MPYAATLLPLVLQGMVRPRPPGFAWFLNLRTGGRLAIGAPFGCVQVGSLPVGVAIDSRLHRTYVASSADELVTILDTRSGRVVGRVRVGGLPTSLAVDTHDNQVVVALESFPGKGTTPSGVACFPANVQQATVPPTQSCAAEGKPFSLGLY